MFPSDMNVGAEIIVFKVIIVENKLPVEVFPGQQSGCSTGERQIEYFHVDVFYYPFTTLPSSLSLHRKTARLESVYGFRF